MARKQCAACGTVNDEINRFCTGCKTVFPGMTRDTSAGKAPSLLVILGYTLLIAVGLAVALIVLYIVLVLFMRMSAR